MRLHQFGASCHGFVIKNKLPLSHTLGDGIARSRPSGSSAYSGGTHANLAAAFLRLFNQRQLL
jgi:hypothetical protein